MKRELVYLAATGLVAASGCASMPEGRSVIDSVAIEGTQEIDADDLEEHLATTPSPKFLALFRGVVFDYTVFDQGTLDRDLERVERYYRARGYYDAQARSGLAIPTKTGHVKVLITVHEGPPVLVGRVTVEGVDGLPEKLHAQLGRRIARTLPVGAVFDETPYEKVETDAAKVLTDDGYAFAKVKRRSQVDLVAHTADVVLTIEPGNVATLGDIRFEGLGKLPELPVKRAFALKTGEKYSTAELDAARISVLDLGVFATVEVRPDLTPQDDPAPKVPILVKVEPSKLHGVRLGGGVELDLIRADLHATVGWDHENFLGGLRKLSIDLQPGVVFYPTRLPTLQAPTHLLPEEKTRIELSQPGFLEARTRGIVRTEYNIYPVLLSPQIDPTASVIGYRELRGAAGLSRTFWKLFGQITYNYQQNTPFTYVGPLDSSLSGITLSYIDLLTQLDFRNDKVSPHKGVFLSNDLQVAGGPLFGDARDVRVQPEARFYVPTTRHTTIAVRGTLGFLFPLNYGTTLTDNADGRAQPAGVDRASWVKDVQLVYFRAFFSGGPNSNRGYPLAGVGPHGVVPFFNPTLAAKDLANSCDHTSPTFDVARCAQPLGGLTLWELSGEFRFPISGPLTSAVFCDTSDVSTGRAQLRFNYLHLSCGTGFRYGTPVGPIRLDVGYRIPGMQILGQPDSSVEGSPGTIFGAPIAVSLGIGEAF